MLRALVVLFTCLFAGNLFNRLTGVPVPGPVIGLLIMLAFLVLGGAQISNYSRWGTGCCATCQFSSFQLGSV